MTSTSTAQAELDQAAVETDALDETRLGTFAGWGATRATYRQDLLAHLTYPPMPGERIYEVDPQTGLIVRRLA